MIRVAPKGYKPGFTGKPPMTADEARENIAAFRSEKADKQLKQIIKLALGGYGNLTPEAREVYAKELERL